MIATASPSGRVGAITLDAVRQLRAADVPIAAIAARAGVTRGRITGILTALGMPYPHGGARSGAGRHARRRCARVVFW